MQLLTGCTRLVDYLCKYFGNVCKIIDFFHNPLKIFQKNLRKAPAAKAYREPFFGMNNLKYREYSNI